MHYKNNTLCLIHFHKPIIIFNTPIFPRYSTDSHNHLSDVKKKGRMHWKEHNMTSGQSLIDNLRHQSCHNKRNNWNLSIHVLLQSWLDISSSNKMLTTVSLHQMWKTEIGKRVFAVLIAFMFMFNWNDALFRIFQHCNIKISFVDTMYN